MLMFQGAQSEVPRYSGKVRQLTLTRAAFILAIECSINSTVYGRLMPLPNFLYQILLTAISAVSLLNEICIQNTYSLASRWNQLYDIIHVPRLSIGSV